MLTGLQFPYADFFTATATSDFLFRIMWSVVQHLEMCGFKVIKIPGTREATLFVRMFDKAFDCLNLRSLRDWKEKIKLDLKPYKSPSDEILQVLE